MKTFFMNSNAPEEVLYKLNEHSKNNWRKNFLTKMTRKAENKWGNYEETLAKCQHIDTVQEIKRSVGITDGNFENMTELEKRGRTIRGRDSPPPFARATKSEDVLSRIPRDTSSESRIIFQNLTTRKEFLRAKVPEFSSIRTERANKQKFRLKMDSFDADQSAKYNFITTRSNMKCDDGCLNERQGLLVASNNKSERKRNPLSPLKRTLRMSNHSNRSAESLSTQPEMLINGKGSYYHQKNLSTEQITVNDSSMQQVDVPKAQINNLRDKFIHSQRKLAAQELASDDPQKNRILNALKIPSLKQKPFAMLHKLLGTQDSWLESKRIATEPSMIEQVKSSTRIETLQSETNRDRMTDTSREILTNSIPKVAFTNLRRFHSTKKLSSTSLHI